MTDDRTNTAEDHEHLNMEAMLALGLARASIIDPIVALLRSDAPIDPTVRNAIADAFEGKRPGGAPQFIVRGTGRGAHTGLSMEHFKRDVSIARFVAARRSAGALKEDALREAADQFRMSVKTCDAAVTKTAKMDRWIASAPAESERTSSFSHLSDLDWQRFLEQMYWARFIWKDKD